MPKILTFRICAEWFQNLKNGIVEHRFREATPHWQSRLIDKNGDFKHFDEVHIVNGYAKDSPRAVVEFAGIIPMTNDAGAPGFEIRLGRVKEIHE